ncbi:aldo/keto reductase [Microbacterium aoyamense]
MPELYGYQVSTDRAVDTVLAVLDSPITMIDTSNGYGFDGAAERVVGEAIRRVGGVPDGVIIHTKVDPDPATRDFSGARVRRSLEESLERLGLDRVPLLALHDPEFMTQDGFAPGGALEELVRIRDEGIAGHLAVAGGSVRVLQEYLETDEFDVVLNHSRYTLLDRSAAPLFAWARERNIGVMNAAPYGGGMLSKGPAEQPRYGYSERGEIVALRAQKMKDACDRRGVPLAAAALDFSVGSELVDTTVLGMSSPERVAQTLMLLETPIPEELRAELDALALPPENWLG